MNATVLIQKEALNQLLLGTDVLSDLGFSLMEKPLWENQPTPTHKPTAMSQQGRWNSLTTATMLSKGT